MDQSRGNCYRGRHFRSNRYNNVYSPRNRGTFNARNYGRNRQVKRFWNAADNHDSYENCQNFQSSMNYGRGDYYNNQASMRGAKRKCQSPAKYPKEQKFMQMRCSSSNITDREAGPSKVQGLKPCNSLKNVNTSPDKGNGKCDLKISTDGFQRKVQLQSSNLEHNSVVSCKQSKTQHNTNDSSSKSIPKLMSSNVESDTCVVEGKGDVIANEKLRSTKNNNDVLMSDDTIDQNLKSKLSDKKMDSSALSSHSASEFDKSNAFNSVINNSATTLLKKSTIKDVQMNEQAKNLPGYNAKANKKSLNLSSGVNGDEQISVNDLDPGDLITIDSVDETCSLGSADIEICDENRCSIKSNKTVSNDGVSNCINNENVSDAENSFASKNICGGSNIVEPEEKRIIEHKISAEEMEWQIIDKYESQTSGYFSNNQKKKISSKVLSAGTSKNKCTSAVNNTQKCRKVKSRNDCANVSSSEKSLTTGQVQKINIRSGTLRLKFLLGLEYVVVSSSNHKMMCALCKNISMGILALHTHLTSVCHLVNYMGLHFAECLRKVDQLDYASRVTGIFLFSKYLVAKNGSKKPNYISNETFSKLCAYGRSSRVAVMKRVTDYDPYVDNRECADFYFKSGKFMFGCHALHILEQAILKDSSREPEAVMLERLINDCVSDQKNVSDKVAPAKQNIESVRIKNSKPFKNRNDLKNSNVVEGNLGCHLGEKANDSYDDMPLVPYEVKSKKRAVSDSENAASNPTGKSVIDDNSKRKYVENAENFISDDKIYFGDYVVRDINEFMRQKINEKILDSRKFSEIQKNTSDIENLNTAEISPTNGIGNYGICKMADVLTGRSPMRCCENKSPDSNISVHGGRNTMPKKTLDSNQDNASKITNVVCSETGDVKRTHVSKAFESNIIPNVTPTNEQSDGLTSSVKNLLNAHIELYKNNSHSSVKSCREISENFNSGGGDVKKNRFTRQRSEGQQKCESPVNRSKCEDLGRRRNSWADERLYSDSNKEGEICYGERRKVDFEQKLSDVSINWTEPKRTYCDDGSDKLDSSMTSVEKPITDKQQLVKRIRRLKYDPRLNLKLIKINGKKHEEKLNELRKEVEILKKTTKYVEIACLGWALKLRRVVLSDEQRPYFVYKRLATEYKQLRIKVQSGLKCGNHRDASSRTDIDQQVTDLSLPALPTDQEKQSCIKKLATALYKAGLSNVSEDQLKVIHDNFNDNNIDAEPDSTAEIDTVQNSDALEQNGAGISSFLSTLGDLGLQWELSCSDTGTKRLKLSLKK